MSDSMKQWAALPIRLVLGVGFVYHGFPKLFSQAGHEMFVGMLQGIGVPMPEAGPQFGMPGYEVPLLYIAGLAALLLSGPGGFSVDERTRPTTA